MKHTRSHLHLPRSVGERSADAVARAMGSWKFIIIQTCIVVVWMVCNVVGFVHHWDIYPFILLNLLFSTQAAYAAPIIMMSQNRQAQVDRLRDDQEAVEVHTMTALLDAVHQINVNQTILLQELRAERGARRE